MNYEALQKRIFGQKPKSEAMGNYCACYSGYSMDPEIRFNSASGGLITQLLVFALENGIIDGAIVTRMSKATPWQPEAFIARTKEEIIEASKSKYCPVATNVCLNQILKEDGRFALVGLPCHIHGIRKAQKALKPLEKKIVLQLGLTCSHTVDFDGVNFLLKKLGVDKNQVRSLTYRGEGWPGFLSIETKNGKKSVPYTGGWYAYWPLFAAFFFTPMRCTLCPDHTAELADISFGDAWLPEFKHKTGGTSIVISRSQKGQCLLDEAKLAGAVALSELSIQKVEQSQRINIKFKKKDLPSRLSIMDSMGRASPSNTGLQPALSLVSVLRAFYIYSSIKASSNEYFRSLLNQTPFPLIRLYYGIYKFLSII